jgi:hypothetical protein
MPTLKELIRSGRKEELWQMCCGFLDLNIEQFMSIQKRLLIEQIELLNNSKIGRKIFKGTIPQDVDEFRKRAPLTTYQDYCPELSEKMDDAMPAKPLYWQHTSGRSADYPFKWESIKWMPISPGFARELSIVGTAVTAFAGCQKKGDVTSLKKGLKYIYAVAPKPYTSGTLAHIVSEDISGKSMPSTEQAEKMSFEERIASGFKQALSEGLDFYFGVTVALVTIGEKLNQQMSSVNIKGLFSHPRALPRFVRGLIKSKMAGRKLLPKDLWDLKGIICSGTDGTIFRDLIHDTWGRYPLNMYASTEGGFIAMQTWDYKNMVFTPSLNFLEFIPEPEYTKWQADHTYIPKTILFDEVQAGNKYELVISNFHGAPLIRYRTGDVIKITSMRNMELDINLPQMEFVGRVDDILDIGGFIRLTERVIWQAVSDTGIPYVDWTARKEFRQTIPILHLFIELKREDKYDEEYIAQAIYGQLKKMDEDFMYGNIEDLLNMLPITVTLLPTGAFESYINLRRAAGADLAHLKPRHINPTEKEIALLKKAHPVEPESNKISVGAPAAS